MICYENKEAKIINYMQLIILWCRKLIIGAQNPKTQFWKDTVFW